MAALSPAMASICGWYSRREFPMFQGAMQLTFQVEVFLSP